MSMTKVMGQVSNEAGELNSQPDTETVAQGYGTWHRFPSRDLILHG